MLTHRYWEANGIMSELLWAPGTNVVAHTSQCYYTRISNCTEVPAESLVRHVIDVSCLFVLGPHLKQKSVLDSITVGRLSVRLLKCAFKEAWDACLSWQRLSSQRQLNLLARCISSIRCAI